MNWRERTAEARRLGEFQTTDRTLASSWNTCYIGEHRQRGHLIEGKFTVDGPPVNFMLFTLGMSFSRRVFENDFDGVERIMDQIDALIPELKRNAGDRQ